MSRMALKATVALVATCAGARAPAGELGPTSRETIGISLTVAPRIDVRTIGKIETAGASSNSSFLSAGVCVSASTPTRSYGVSLLEPSVPSRFHGGSASEQTFIVEWASEPGQAVGNRIDAGMIVMGFVASETSCTPQSPANARLIVRSLSRKPNEQSAAAAILLIVPE